MCVTFQKYRGLEKDYLVYDCTENSVKLSPENIRAICSTNFGLASNGILVGPIWKNDEVYMQAFNPDGTEADSSEDGACIFAKYLKKRGLVKAQEYILHTLNGPAVIHCSYEQDAWGNDSDTDLSVSLGMRSYAGEELRQVSATGKLFVEDHFVNRVAS